MESFIVVNATLMKLELLVSPAKQKIIKTLKAIIITYSVYININVYSTKKKDAIYQTRMVLY